MRMCRSFRTVLVFLFAAAMVVAGWHQNGNCAEKSLKEEMRMPWTGQEAEFLREWLICGVFPSPPPEGDSHPRQGYDTDFLKELGGEAAARPAAGQTVKRSDGSTVAWTEYNSNADIIDFVQAFSGEQNTDVVAYAYKTISRDEAGKGVLALGSDDSVKVWLNGELVHSHAVGRAVGKDEDIVPVALKEGDNSLLIKVENGVGGWGFVLRVLSENQAMALETGAVQARIEESDEDNVLIISIGAGVGAELTEKIKVEAVAAGGKVVSGATTKRGESVRFETSDWPDGPYEIRVSTLTPEDYWTFSHLSWYKGDWMKQVRELMEECDRLPANPGKPSDLRCRVIGQLVLDRLGGDLSAEFGPEDWNRVHSPLMEHRELQLGDDACIRPHGFIRLAWIDEIDDSPQFARAYLPPDYDPDKKWPMVVSLHGYNSANPEYIHWWSVTDRHNGIAERHNVIVIEPHGRANTSYNGIGDMDVLKAISIAKEKFSVNAGKVYLMGYSMGGGGTWHVGTRHPELFAAIGPVYGGWDYHVWSSEEDLAKMTPRQRFEAESESSFAQADALLTTPVFINHGDSDDLVNIDQSRYVLRMMQRWGYNVRYWEHPGKGHGALGCEDELIRWFLTHRLDRNPRQVRVRSSFLKSASAHWVRVEQREDPFAFIYVDARAADPHTIRINTENVLQVRLTPRDEIVDHNNPVRVIWNGKDVGMYEFSSGGIKLRAEGYKPAKFHKTPQVAGPIDDVTVTPFAIVVGTISEDQRMRRFCQLRAEALRDAWKVWQHVEPRYFLDTEITDEQIRKYSLLLFGGPSENLVTQKLIEQIPLKIEQDKITIGGQSFDVKDASVSMVYPNPLNPERYVSIAAGNSPTGMFFSDRAPGNVDFSIIEAIVDGERIGIPTEKARTVVGCFDHNWQYSEKYVTRGDPAMMAKAPARKSPRHMASAVDADRLMLSELLETRSAGSFNYMGRDLNWQGGPLKLADKIYDSGIGVEVWHEPCTVTYDLSGGDWKRLKATIGIEVDKKPEEIEQKEKNGTLVYFVVRGDGEELYRSPTFRWDSGPAEMDVDISGVKTLELEVANEATWHNIASSVNWADVRLEK